MNKLFDIPKMRIVVISAAVVVTLAVITVTVACLKVNAPTGDKDAVDAMVSVSESDTEPPVSEIPETETEKIPDDEEGLLYQNNGNGRFLYN